MKGPSKGDVLIRLAAATEAGTEAIAFQSCLSLKSQNAIKCLAVGLAIWASSE
jgi:hypothetical protein